MLLIASLGNPGEVFGIDIALCLASCVSQYTATSLTVLFSSRLVITVQVYVLRRKQQYKYIGYSLLLRNSNEYAFRHELGACNDSLCLPISLFMAQQHGFTDLLNSVSCLVYAMASGSQAQS